MAAGGVASKGLWKRVMKSLHVKALPVVPGKCISRKKYAWLSKFWANISFNSVFPRIF